MAFDNKCPNNFRSIPLEYQPSQMNQAFLYSNQACTTIQGSTNGQQYVVYNDKTVPVAGPPAVRYTTCASSATEAVTNVQNLQVDTPILSGGGNQSEYCVLVPQSQTSITYAIYKPV